METESKSNFSETVNKIKMINQAGAITMLKGYVKVSEYSETYYKCGATDNYPVGKTRTLDLTEHLGKIEHKDQTRDKGYIFEGDLVTAYAAIEAHSDVHGAVWLKFDPKANRTAVFTLSGPLWDLYVGFTGLE